MALAKVQAQAQEEALLQEISLLHNGLPKYHVLSNADASSSNNMNLAYTIIVPYYVHEMPIDHIYDYMSPSFCKSYIPLLYVVYCY